MLPDIHLQLNESGGPGGYAHAGTVDGDNDMKNTYGPRELIGPNALPPVSGDLSQANITSNVADVSLVDILSVQFSWTGNAVVNAVIETSNDQAHWNLDVDIPADGSSSTSYGGDTINGVAGTFRVDLQRCSAPYLRVRVTRVSGSGSLVVNAAGKG